MGSLTDLTKPLEEVICSSEMYWLYSSEAAVSLRLPLVYLRIIKPEFHNLEKLVHEVFCHCFDAYSYIGPAWAWYSNQISNSYFLRLIRKISIKSLLNDEKKYSLLKNADTRAQEYFKIMKAPMEAIGGLRTMELINMHIVIMEEFRRFSSIVVAAKMIDEKSFRPLFGTKNINKTLEKIETAIDDKLHVQEVIANLENLKLEIADAIKQSEFRDLCKELSELKNKFNSNILEVIASVTLNVPFAPSLDDLHNEQYNPSLRLKRILKDFQFKECYVSRLETLRESIMRKFKWISGTEDFLSILNSKNPFLKEAKPIVEEVSNKMHVLCESLQKALEELERNTSELSTKLVFLLSMLVFFAQSTPVFTYQVNSDRTKMLYIRDDVRKNLQKESFWLLNFSLTWTKEQLLKQREKLECPIHNPDQKAEYFVFSKNTLQLLSEKCEFPCPFKGNLSKCNKFLDIIDALYQRAYTKTLDDD